MKNAPPQPTGETLRRKDRHSKVFTARGPRDRRVRLAAHTAIQFYDVQDRLGYDRPSKAVDWLIKKAKTAIDKLNMTPSTDSNSNPSSENRIGFPIQVNCSHNPGSSSLIGEALNTFQVEDLGLSLQSFQGIQFQECFTGFGGNGNSEELEMIQTNLGSQNWNQIRAMGRQSLEFGNPFEFDFHGNGRVYGEDDQQRSHG